VTENAMNWFPGACRNAGLLLHRGWKRVGPSDRQGRVVIDTGPEDERTVVARRTVIEEIEIREGVEAHRVRRARVQETESAG